jgi:tetratricopeptide (TPR) repeat protein
MTPYTYTLFFALFGFAAMFPGLCVAEPLSMDEAVSPLDLFSSLDTSDSSARVPPGEGEQKTAEEWAALGDALVELHRDAEANTAYEYALLLDPTDSKTWSKRGQILVRENKYDQALEAYRRALARSPDEATTWNALGSLLFQMGYLAEAVAAFEKAVALDPGHIPRTPNVEENDITQVASNNHTEENPESTSHDNGFPLIFLINISLIGGGLIIIILLSQINSVKSHSASGKEK